MNFSGKKLFLVSDTHFSHSNIIKYCHRPFLNEKDKAELAALGGKWHSGSWKRNNYRISDESREMMNDALINNINAIVGSDDTLWHLGDFSMKPKGDEKKIREYYWRCKKLRDRIKCQNIHFVFGNHDDRCIADLFSTAHDLTDFRVDGQMVVVAHYALAIWNKSHRKSWMLYGHSHSEAEDWLNRFLPGRRSMDVGVDNAAKLLGAYRPFTFDEVGKILEKRKGHSIGDHHIDPNAPEEDGD